MVDLSEQFLFLTTKETCQQEAGKQHGARRLAQLEQVLP